MELEQRFLFGMANTIILPPAVVRIAFERVNCSEVGRRGEKIYCDYVEYELVWRIQIEVSGRHLIL